MSQSRRVEALEQKSGQVRDRQPVPVDLDRFAADGPVYCMGVEVVPGQGDGYVRVDDRGVAVIRWADREDIVYLTVPR